MTEAQRSPRGWLSRLLAKPRARAAETRFSAYLSIYNDWDLLAPSLASIAPYLDELVVVDGAYGWMVPYLQRLGIDPERSDPRVAAALNASGIPFRILHGLWANEIDKRRAGYEACGNRYVVRIDADEILHIDDTALESFLASGAAVGEMETPTYVAPGYVVADTRQAHLPRVGFLFDRDQISSEAHLNYLWMVLTKDALPSAARNELPVYPDPIAFSAHLTGWRTPETAEQRSAFYALNRLRQSGIGWFEDLKGRPLEDFDLLFSRVSAASFRNMLRHARFSLGAFALSPDQTLARSPLTARQEQAFAPLYESFLASLAEDNVASTSTRQSFGWDGDVFIDLSSPAAYDAVVKNGEIAVQFSSAPSGLAANAHALAVSAPQSAETPLEVRLDGPIVRIAAPALAQGDVLRLVLSMRPQGGEGPLGDYLIL